MDAPGSGTGSGQGRPRRPLVVLFGEPSHRPPTLERDLLRAGFQVVEAGDSGLLPDQPSLVVATCDGRADDCHQLGDAFASARATGARVVLLIHNGEPEDLVRAAEAGADDASLLPGDAGELIARLRACLVAPRSMIHGPDGSDLRLFELLQEVAAELHRDDMLHALVTALGQSLGIGSVSCLLHAEGSVTGRLVAATENPRSRDVDVHLAPWPEALAALAAGDTVSVRDARASDLFRPKPGRPLDETPPADIVSSAAILLRPHGRPVGTVVLRTRESERDLTAGHIAFAELAVQATARLLEADDRRGAISRRQALASQVDPLTGCGTLDALDRRIREEFERARRYDVTFALVLLDVDGMRHINERLGRDGGHRVLADLGRLLQRELRAPDFVARYGGEEFLLLLPETDYEAARRTIHRIRDRMGPAGLGDLHLGARCRITAGVVTYPHPQVHKPEDLFALAEAAMQAGKAQDVERIGTAA